MAHVRGATAHVPRRVAMEAIMLNPELPVLKGQVCSEQLSLDVDSAWPCALDS